LNPLPTASLWPALALVLNAFVWGVSWWPLRQLEAVGVHPLWATVMIYIVAVVTISLARPTAWRELATRRTLWLLVLASGTTNAAFNWAVTIGDVVRVVLLFYLMPLWAVLLARLLLNERFTGSALLRVALALGGALVILWPPGDGLPVPRSLPEALGLLGGFAFALNNVMLKREAARSEGARALAMFVGGALVAASIAALLAPAGTVPPLPPLAPGWVAGTLALAACFLGSNLALQYGATRLPAHATAVIMLTEVFFASASALALGAGKLDLRLAIGGGAIIGAALLAARQHARGPRPDAGLRPAA
jgi:drug/metabolite transporter (DMT)-like permease